MMKEFYENCNYPAFREFVSLKSPIKYDHNSDILIVGCGTHEANLISEGLNKSKIDAIDFSLSTIKIAKSIKRKLKIKNINYICADFENFESSKKYDVIYCNGVLHHLYDIEKSLVKIKNLLKENGKIIGFVYGERISEIKWFNKFFIENNYTYDDVINYFENVSDKNSEKIWYNFHIKTKEEICDTWLNPHFVEYSYGNLFKIISKYFKNFKIEKIYYDNVDINSEQLHFTITK